MSTTENSLPPGMYVLPLTVQFNGEEMKLSLSAIETKRGLLLLDTGFPNTLDQLRTQLQKRGFNVSDIEMVLVTHKDQDHAGGLSDVISEAEPFVIAHERDTPAIDGRTKPRDSTDNGRYPPGEVDLELGGEAIFSTQVGPVRVIPTPGHTPGHLSVYLPEERFLIAADALMVEDGLLTGPEPDLSENLSDALISVTHLSQLRIDHVLCYHGGVVNIHDGCFADISQQIH